jgi:hypothetical protein
MPVIEAVTTVDRNSFPRCFVSCPAFVVNHFTTGFTEFLSIDHTLVLEQVEEVGGSDHRYRLIFYPGHNNQEYNQLL